MTEKPKTQLFSVQVLLISTVIVSLVVFFLVATLLDTTLFLPLDLGLLIIIVYLFGASRRLAAVQATLHLKNEEVRERSNLLEAQIKIDEAAIKSFQDKILDSLQLKGLTEKLSRSLTLDETVRTLVGEAHKILGTEGTTIILYLLHSPLGELGIIYSQQGDRQVNIRSKKGDDYDRWQMKNMQSLLITDTKSDYRFDFEKAAGKDERAFRSLISVPLVLGSKTLGLLRLDNPQPGQFTTEDLRFLTAIGDLGAVAIENAHLYERLQQLAVKDGLTGLSLRRYLLERMPEEITRQLRANGVLSFLMIDIDHFKQYNDTFGHVAGDIVLRTVGKILHDFFTEPGTIVSRYGGEEFAVLLPDCSKARAIELAEMLRKNIEKQTVTLRREKTNVTVSVGVAAFPVDAKLKDELINKADSALYKAKNSGRNKVCAV